jgi:hypothetical protein
MPAASRDKWTEKLKCPKCGKVGEARLSQAELYAFLRGDNKTSLDFLSEGFSSVGEGMAIAFICTDCQVRAR